MNNNSLKIIYLCVFMVFILVCGCGYTTQAYNLPARLKTVYIDTFANQSDQPNIENELRTKLIAAFQDEGHLRVSNKEDADTILAGKVVSYSRQAMRYANDETIEEYRLTVTVKFDFTDSFTQEIIIRSDSFSGDTSYYISGSSAKTERSARTDALDHLSHRILNKIITLW